MNIKNNLLKNQQVQTTFLHQRRTIIQILSFNMLDS